MADNIFDENKNAANEISSNPYIKKEEPFGSCGSEGE